MAKVALIGDFNPDVVAHRVIPQALDLAAKQVGVSVTWDWVGTNTITDAPRQLAGHGGIWCVPGSPYRSMDGALAAIRFARETRRPFLGTCGGFQHVLVETARNVLGISNADHAETAPAISALPAVSRVEPSKSTEGGRVERPPLVVTPLACSPEPQPSALSCSVPCPGPARPDTVRA